MLPSTEIRKRVKSWQETGKESALEDRKDTELFTYKSI
jgi:hypothetical protein